MQVTFKQIFSYNTTLCFKYNAGFIQPDMYESYRIYQENETWSGLEPTCTGTYLGQAKGKCVFGVYAGNDEPYHPVRSEPLVQ